MILCVPVFIIFSPKSRDPENLNNFYLSRQGMNAWKKRIRDSEKTESLETIN